MVRLAQPICLEQWFFHLCRLYFSGQSGSSVWTLIWIQMIVVLSLKCCRMTPIYSYLCGYLQAQAVVLLLQGKNFLLKGFHTGLAEARSSITVHIAIICIKYYTAIQHTAVLHNATHTYMKRWKAIQSGFIHLEDQAWVFQRSQKS